MPVHIDEITNDVSVAGPAIGGAAAAPAAAAGATEAQPSLAELVKARAQGEAVRRSLARTAVEPRRRGEGTGRHA